MPITPPDLMKYKEVARLDSIDGDFSLIVRTLKSRAPVRQRVSPGAEAEPPTLNLFLQPKNARGKARFNEEDEPFVAVDGSISVGSVGALDSLSAGIHERLRIVREVYGARFDAPKALRAVRTCFEEKPGRGGRS